MNINREHFPIANYPPWKDISDWVNCSRKHFKKRLHQGSLPLRGAAWGGRGWQWAVCCCLLCMCSVLALSRSPALSLGAHSSEPRLRQRRFQGHPLLRQAGRLSAALSRDFSGAVLSRWEFVSLLDHLSHNFQVRRQRSFIKLFQCFHFGRCEGGAMGWRQPWHILCSKQKPEVVLGDDNCGRFGVSGCWWLVQPEVTQQPCCGWQSWCCFVSIKQEEARSQLPPSEPRPARLRGSVKVVHSVLGRQWMIFCSQKQKIALGPNE